jgi:acyl carrier protein
MNASHAQIVECLREVFPEAEGLEFTPASTLEELPEWDSMAAVNLQTALRKQFENLVPLEFLSDDTTLEDLAVFLNTAVSREAVC